MPYGVRDWPIIGPQHNDKHCLDFEHTHYHLDARFMPSWHGHHCEWYWSHVAVSPMQAKRGLNAGGFPPVVWKRRECKRLENPQTDALFKRAAESKTFQCLHADYVGRQAKHDGRGWVCPHRSVPLADHAPVDGVIRCPLHFMRIDASTGKVLASEVPSQ
ncbi:Rieske 2Fe-2S domain-containing protein [Affinirhizobium rhizoryzae]|nr:Rieske 2Fe-2S domain-containing protein [Rhizobium rhizoryzae]